MHKFTMISIVLGVVALGGASFYLYMHQSGLVLGLTTVQIPDLQTAPKSLLESGKSYVTVEAAMIGQAVTNAAHSAQYTVNGSLDKVHGILANIPKLLK